MAMLIPRNQRRDHAYGALSLFVILLVCLPLCLAEEPLPRICIGFNPLKNDWEPVGVKGDSVGEENCAPGYAFYSQDFPVGRERPGRKIGIRGACCPLPEGVLTDEHVWVLESCPEGFVVTGGRAGRQVIPQNEHDIERADAEWARVDQYMRCTKIDLRRFQLSEPVETLTIGFNGGFTRNTLLRRFTTAARIPVAIRYGIVRGGRLTFDHGGCIGFPWGALLTRKQHKLCGFEFRQLQYRGAIGDPPLGTPVKVIPDCLSLSDFLSPNPSCITE